MFRQAKPQNAKSIFNAKMDRKSADFIIDVRCYHFALIVVFEETELISAPLQMIDRALHRICRDRNMTVGSKAWLFHRFNGGTGKERNVDFTSVEVEDFRKITRCGLRGFDRLAVNSNVPHRKAQRRVDSACR